MLAAQSDLAAQGRGVGSERPEEVGRAVEHPVPVHVHLVRDGSECCDASLDGLYPGVEFLLGLGELEYLLDADADDVAARDQEIRLELSLGLVYHVSREAGGLESIDGVPRRAVDPPVE